MQSGSIYRSTKGRTKIQIFYDNIIAKLKIASEKIYVPTKHGDTFVIVSGDAAAPPLILLHGTSSNSAMWYGDVEQYSKYYRVYNIDILGEPGKSDMARPSLAGPEYTEWLDDIISYFAINQVSMLSCSLGAFIALNYAASNPGIVEKLVLISPGGIVEVNKSVLFKFIGISILGRWGTKITARMLMGDKKIDGAVFEYMDLVRRYFKPRAELVPVIPDDILQRLSMPVLLIAGDNDCFYNQRSAEERLGKLLPNSECMILENTGHAVMEYSLSAMSFLKTG